jgi:putative acyl-CoA dehydrogenase
MGGDVPVLRYSRVHHCHHRQQTVLTVPTPADIPNQSRPFEDINLFTSDAALQDAVVREGGGEAAAVAGLAAFGAICGSAEMAEHGRLANAHPPVLQAWDHQGRRADRVDFHPSYHDCMSLSISEGLHTPQAIPGANVIRAGALYMAAQMETGHCCPITMTHAAVATLRLAPQIADIWLPRIAARTYDRRLIPPDQKHGVTIGMGMTEPQGGTDLRTNTTAAHRIDGSHYRLTGAKWFLSAPMCDAFLVLAQIETPLKAGPGCFLVPRFRPDNTLNGIHFRRLKDKLGNRSNASSEVDFADADGWLIGDEGRGIAAIMEMVTATRLDCAVASAGLMRRAVAEAIHHCRQRQVFGRQLAEQPVMASVLADLSLQVEACVALSFRLALACDHPASPDAAAWRRLMTPVTKYWVCKSAAPVIAEAMECLGGNGYVETSILPRLYREAPVNSIWEGSGNVMALDVLRVLQREPEAVEIVLDGLEHDAGDDSQLKGGIARIRDILEEPRLVELRARALIEQLAAVAAATMLRRHAPPAIADGFIAARLTGSPRQTFGCGLERADVRAILDRTLVN